MAKALPEPLFLLTHLRKQNRVRKVPAIQSSKKNSQIDNYPYNHHLTS